MRPAGDHHVDPSRLEPQDAVQVERLVAPRPQALAQQLAADCAVPLFQVALHPVELTRQPDLNATRAHVGRAAGHARGQQHRNAGETASHTSPPLPPD